MDFIDYGIPAMSIITAGWYNTNTYKYNEMMQAKQPLVVVVVVVEKQEEEQKKGESAVIETKNLARGENCDDDDNDNMENRNRIEWHPQQFIFDESN